MRTNFNNHSISLKIMSFIKSQVMSLPTHQTNPISTRRSNHKQHLLKMLFWFSVVISLQSIVCNEQPCNKPIHLENKINLLQ